MSAVEKNFTPGSGGGNVSVSIEPQTVTLAPNATQQFTATVAGTSNHAVGWTADCGTVDASGLYTAPGSEGHCHVTATSVADPSAQAVATIAITSVTTSYTLSLNGSNGRVAVNGTTESLPYSSSFPTGNNVALRAIPDSGYKFSNWSGDLSGSTNPISITMDSNKDVTAVFKQQPAAGSLSVTPGSDLTASGPQGGPFSPDEKSYTLTNTGGLEIHWTASKGQNWVSLSRTSGTLAAGESTTVNVSVNNNANSLDTGSHSDTVSFKNATNGNGNTTREVALTVNPPPPTSYTLAVTKSGSGSGTVTSNPSGINCGSTCSAAFDEGTGVTLRATPEDGSTFAGWSGASCSGRTCELTMSSNEDVTATFNVAPPTTHLGSCPVSVDT